jgi:hypothetical protein
VGDLVHAAESASQINDAVDGIVIGEPATKRGAEVAAYDAVGVYGAAGAPRVEGRFDPDLVAGLYADDGAIIWPTG